MSLWWVFVTLGKVVGPLVGSYVSQVSTFRSSFYLSSILCVISTAAVPIMFRRRRRLNPSPDLHDMPGWVTGVRELMSMRLVRVVFIMAAFAFMEVSLMIGYLPIYASEQVGISPNSPSNLAATLPHSNLGNSQIRPAVTQGFRVESPRAGSAITKLERAG
jgi:MFS family permease